MPAVWDLSCQKSIRSRRALFMGGIKALRQDEGVRRVSSSKTATHLNARITFWNEGPVDATLTHLREEFGPSNVSPPVPPPPCSNGLSMGCMVPFNPHGHVGRTMTEFRQALETVVSVGMRAGRSMASVMTPYEQAIVRMLATEDGRQRLAASMATPTRRSRDYPSLARQLFPTPGTVYLASDPEVVGQMPVRQELTVLDAERNEAAPRFNRDSDPNVQPRLIRFPGDPHLYEHRLEPLPMPNSSIFYREFTYGARSNETIYAPNHNTELLNLPSHVPVPPWCVPWAWLYNQNTGRFAIVRSVTKRKTAAKVRNWFKGHLRNHQFVPGEELHRHWSPCGGPKMPRETWWEDLLQDDFAI